ncbi:MAG: laccase domain-containing protein [bacterium]|nr:laccase domain-containing protein [bacterium]
MATIHHRFLGKQEGDFNPNQPDTHQFLDLLDVSFCSRPDDPQKIFFPSCQFTTRVVALGAEDNKIVSEVVTTKRPADGVVIDKTYVAGLIFNADCPVVCIFEPAKSRFAVLHAGFRCLMPAVDSKGKRGRGIIKAAFEDFKFDVSDVKVWAGMGIGPCCYGAEHWPEMKDQSVDIPIGKATRGARAGKKSIDLIQLIYKQVVAQGVKPTKIELDAECTCCKGYFLAPRFHSNCRSGKQAGRNAVGFWMT